MIDVLEDKNTYLAEFARFEKTPNFGSSPWLQDLRRQAISRFSESGFPTTRDEEWRFTNVAPITRIPFQPASRQTNGFAHADLSAFAFSDVECQLVFVNGSYAEDLSQLKALPPGARVTDLGIVLQKADRGQVEPYLARYASTGNAFLALNTAFMSDGALIYLPPRTCLKETIHLIYVSTAAKQRFVTYPRNLIVVGAGSQCSIVESYVGQDQGLYFTNAVSEIVLGEGSTVDYYKLQRESEDAFHIGNVKVLQERDSHFSSHSLSLGGALVRNDLNVVLNGEGADCTLNGLYVTRGRQHVDNHTSIDHAQPHCSSQELYKGILDEHSSGVFNGKIIVRQDAQKTNAKQTNKNLLLSNNALVNTTPQLEISADDVKCTHGATIGQLDREALFYLRSRGIDQAAARTLLTYAFASDVLGNVRIKPIQCQIDLVLLARLSRESGNEML